MSLTVEQRDLRDAVRGLLEKAEAGGSPSWRRLCDEVGVAGLAIPQRYGGAGAGLAEVCVVMAELGRNLTPAPMLGSAVLTAQALLATGDDAACERLLPAIAEQATRLAAVISATGLDPWDAHVAAIADTSVCPILTLDAAKWRQHATDLDAPLHYVELTDPDGSGS
jgi:alkylation response protein AidB-like acyl-CoA dehydrogenase